MVIECDPGRHAVLVHFAESPYPRPVKLLGVSRGVELAIDETFGKPILVAIHFVRHVFWLPFYVENGMPRLIQSKFVQNDEEVRLLLGLFAEYQRVEVSAGLHVFVQQDSTRSKEGESRPELVGFTVDRGVWTVNVDTSCMRFCMGPDGLKDVTADLFVRS